MKETINKPPAKENRRQRMMKDLRNKKRNLKRQLHLANFDEKEGLLKIWQDLKEKQRSQQGGKPEKETSEAKERARAFFQEPYKYANMQGTYLINRNQACSKQRKIFWKNI